MPNLRGASPVSRDERGRSYAARTVNKRRSGRVTVWEHQSPRCGEVAATAESSVRAQSIAGDVGKAMGDDISMTRHGGGSRLGALGIF